MEENGDSLDMRTDRRTAKPLAHVFQLGHCPLFVPVLFRYRKPLICCQNDCCQ